MSAAEAAMNASESALPARLCIGLAIVSVVVATALLSLFWTPFDVTAIDIGSKLLPTSGEHPLGTDHFGRDVLSMIMAGARSSLSYNFV